MTDHPTKIGKYQIRGLLGGGGMAKVYEGYDPVGDRVLAIKVLKDEFADAPEVVASFVQEAKKAIRLENHDAVLTVYEVDQDGDRPFIAMRRVEGRTLQEELRKRGVLPVDRVRGIVAGIGGALEHAHQRGIVHCDVKPSNIMLDRVGRAYLMDFGISRAVGDMLGARLEELSAFTPQYASPEQTKGQAATVRSDIYSFGVVVYEMVTGTTPFGHCQNAAELRQAVVNEAPCAPRDVNPHVPQALDQAVMRALAKDPVARFETMAQFVKAVLQATDERADDPQEAQTLVPRRATEPYPTPVGSNTNGRGTSGSRTSAATATRTAPAPRRASRAAFAVLALAAGIAAAAVFGQEWWHGAQEEAAKGPEKSLAASASSTSGGAPGTGTTRDAAPPDASVPGESHDAGTSGIGAAGDLLRTGAGAVSDALRAAARLPDPTLSGVTLAPGGDLAAARNGEETAGAGATKEGDAGSGAAGPGTSNATGRESTGSEATGSEATAGTPPPAPRTDPDVATTGAESGSHAQPRALPPAERAHDEGVPPGPPARVAGEVEHAAERAAPSGTKTAADPEPVTAPPPASVEVRPSGSAAGSHPTTGPSGAREPTAPVLAQESGPAQVPPAPEPAVYVLPAAWQVEVVDATPCPLTALPRRVRDLATGTELVLVPPGTFEMGSEDDDVDGRDDERPARLVTISRPFYLATTEVTMRQWRAYARETGASVAPLEDLRQRMRRPGFAQAAWAEDHPVLRVSWSEAADFCGHYGFQLPTEAQWEYACRAGTRSAFWFGDDPMQATGVENTFDGKAKAASATNADRFTEETWGAQDDYLITAPVGRLRANPLGLHDMHGNVREWCRDAYDPTAYQSLGGVDPVQRSGRVKVARGGSWRSPPQSGRAASRAGEKDGPHHDVGFRVLRVVGEPTK